MFFALGAYSRLFDNQAVKIKKIGFRAVGIVWYTLQDSGLHRVYLGLLFAEFA